MRILEHKSWNRLKVPEAPLMSHFMEAKHTEEDLKCTVPYVAKTCTADTQRELMQQEVF